MLKKTSPKQHQPKHTICNQLFERKLKPRGTPRGLLEGLGRLLGGSLEVLGCLLGSLGSLLGPLRLPKGPQDRPRSDFCRFGLPKWSKIRSKSSSNRCKIHPNAVVFPKSFSVRFSLDPRESPKRPHRQLKAQSSKLTVPS